MERYRGSDLRAMAADDTSAFNCRHVTGNPTRLSQHPYGIAIDVNAVENPYVTRSRVYPAAGRSFLDRSPYRKGMILRGSVTAKAFAREEWPWGARRRYPDYQHFSRRPRGRRPRGRRRRGSARRRSPRPPGTRPRVRTPSRRSRARGR